MKTIPLLLFFLFWLCPISALAKPQKVLMVVTSADQLGGQPTGLWLEEFAIPYQVFRDAGLDVVVASPQGAEAPIDPRSLESFEGWEDAKWTYARQSLQNTVKLAQVQGQDFDAMFLSGGHGTVVDFPENAELRFLILSLLAFERPVAAVCHAPVAFTGIENLVGEPIVASHRVTGFSNSEEARAKLGPHVPFLLETRLKELRGHYEKGPDFESFVVTDRLLITGQNPASSRAASLALIEALKKAPSPKSTGAFWFQ